MILLGAKNVLILAEAYRRDPRAQLDTADVGTYRTAVGIVRASRIVSVHVPLTAETRGMIGAAELAAMPDGALFINTARAALLDQEALVAELERGRLRAVLDVTTPEVLPRDHALLRLPTAIVTPHLAGAMGNELLRLGGSAFAEIMRLAHAVHQDQLCTSA